MIYYNKQKTTSCFDKHIGFPHHDTKMVVSIILFKECRLKNKATPLHPKFLIHQTFGEIFQNVRKSLTT